MEQDIIRQAVRSGQPIPDRIANAPKLRIGLRLFLQAFFDLDSERDQGWGLGRIPWTAMRQYALFYELDQEQSDALIHFVQVMDTAFLKWAKDKGPKDKDG